MRAPETLRTARLVLARPTVDDAPEIFAGFAGDPEVTRYLGWPRHRSVEDTLEFVRISDETWAGTGAGPYLVRDRAGDVVGSTGLDVEAHDRASTGYLLAPGARGRGYATEMARAMVALAADLGVRRLTALCHPANRASARVLARAGFVLDEVLAHHLVFPNLDEVGPQDVERWVRAPAGDG